MRKFWNAGVITSAFLFLGCSPSVQLEKGDTISVYVSNYSIQNFESYIDCSKVLDAKSPDHVKIVRLVAQMQHDAFENEDGSHYYTISITDSNDVEKASVTVPQGGGGHRKSKELFKLLDEICAD